MSLRLLMPAWCTGSHGHGPRKLQIVPWDGGLVEASHCQRKDADEKKRLIDKMISVLAPTEYSACPVGREGGAGVHTLCTL